MKVDPRFLTEDGPEIFNGNELLIKGALETEGGVHLLGGYPGSPAAAYFDAMAHIKDLLAERGIRAVMNCNEALATAMLNGSQLVGCRGMIVMKSVGVHVAADALAIGNLAGAHPSGGAIVVYGDDPWSDSTQVPADSRFISRHLFIPVIEPGNPQEIKDYVDLAFKLSRGAELYAGFVLPTNLADGGGSVQCRPNQYPTFNTNQRVTLDTAAIDVNKFVLLPPKTWWQEAKLGPRLERAIVLARELGLNRIEYGHNLAEQPGVGRKPLGFITSGMAHGYLRQALWEMGLLGDYPILKLGMTYPVDAEMVRRLAGQCERIVVVEERRGFIEEQVSQIVLKDRQNGRGIANCELRIAKSTGEGQGHQSRESAIRNPQSAIVEVWGKQFPPGLRGLPDSRGLHPSIIIERLVPLLELIGGGGGAGGAAAKAEAALVRELRTIDSTAQLDVGNLPVRSPTFCPGCPHRDSADLCLEIKKRFMDEAYMRRRHNRGPVDLVFHGDTGCYTMLMYAPNTPLMHDYSGMGLGGGTGTGTDPFITNKQVVFMGDGTFFHSGQLAISQAIKFGQDITFIILDNSTTAMTGHQPTSGVDYDIVGNPTPVQDVAEIVTGMAGTSNLTVVRADPEMRREYRELLERTFLADGVKVVVADKECGITRMRRKRRAERAVAKRLGFLPVWQHMNINTELCRFCMACAELTGCPGLKHVQTDYGLKMDTDISWCVDDGACERIRACSSFERVTIKRKRPPRIRLPELDSEAIPEPVKRPVGDLWRCYLSGVGGMGIGVATSILVRAGHKEGYEVIFLDKKGLAIRNGGVNSQVVYNISRQPITAVIPYGKADLLIGVDILEAARALDPRGRSRIASADRTAAVINTDRIQTIPALVGREDDFDPAALEALIRRYTRGDDFLARNISRICEKYLGNKLYANIMMLGFAFQKGLIPVSMHSMAWAIKDTILADIRKNLYAFNMGRMLVLKPDLFKGPPQRADWRALLEEKCRWLLRRYGRRGQKMSDRFREMTAGAVAAAEKLDDATRRAVVIRAYDCTRWGGPDYAKRYLDAVVSIYKRDNDEQGRAATLAVIHNLAGAMLIKDGPFIAELATSPEKHARDREKYSVNPANGDRIIYRHLLHPTFRVGPWTWSPDIALGKRGMKVLRRMRWLRSFGAWHRQEKRFLKQYEALISQFKYADAAEYRQRLAALSSPRCMNCMNPSCRELGCPLEGNVPECLQLVYEGRWREAADKLHEKNNFPEFTSRICPAFCEDWCKQDHGGYAVAFKDTEARIIDTAFEQGWIQPRPAARKTGKKVAVVGSGPAGLAAAQELARAGHGVTVFEKDPAVGGLLRNGIPGFRLDKALIDRRVDQLTAEGVTFKTGVVVGRDVAADELRRQFDAVLLALGASRSRDLNVPGRNLSGIHLAIDYLRSAGGNGQQATGNRQAGDAGDSPGDGNPKSQIPNPKSSSPTMSAAGKSVVVIGGGLTGEDCVETAVLQGAREVHQLEILPKPPQKARGHAAQDPDQVSRRFCISTRAFVGRNGGLSELRAAKVRWIPTADGPAMRDEPDGDFTIKADMALLALGFDAAIDPRIAAQLNIALDAHGRAVLNNVHATSAAGVFVAGDAATGATYVATAIDSGRSGARAIDEFLKGQ